MVSENKSSEACTTEKGLYNSFVAKGSDLKGPVKISSNSNVT